MRVCEVWGLGSRSCLREGGEDASPVKLIRNVIPVVHTVRYRMVQTWTHPTKESQILESVRYRMVQTWTHPTKESQILESSRCRALVTELQVV